jgi:WD40 repeat protein
MSIQLEKYRQKKAHKDIVVSLRYSPTGRFLVSADQSGKIVVWPEGRTRGVKQVRSPYEVLTGVWFSEDEEWLLAGHEGGHLLVYSLPKLKRKAEIRLKPSRPEGYMLSGTSKTVLNWVVLTICPSIGSDLYAILEFRDFFAIRRQDLQVTNHVHWPGSLIEYTAASPNGRFVFFGDDMGYIYRFHLPEMKLEIFAEHHERVPGFSFAKNQSTMVDASTGIAGLALSCNNRLVASTSRTGGVQIWQTEDEQWNGANIREFRPFAAREPVRSVWIRGVSFLPESAKLALGTDDGTLEIWNYSSGQVSYIAKCPAGVRSLVASPDGSQLAVGCEDGSVFLIPWGES